METRKTMSVTDVDFFNRNAEEVAIDLLGKYICQKNNNEDEELESGNYCAD